LPLLGLDPGRLFDRFVGETEANLRRALATAAAMAPAVLWIDEIEKALSAEPSRADAGLSRRVAGTLLTWMQERPAPVFLMATANDVEALPVELLRRGRFDEVFFFDLPGAGERERIFALHLELRERRPEGFDLATLAAATDGFSGAEIEGVVAAGLYHAFSERRPLTTEVLLAEAEATRPLSRLRPEAVAALRAWGNAHARAA
jgi:SpoVK/Ycf46/Vps4 family AAA+-type ATPase